MARKCVTLYIDDATLKLVVTRGDHVKTRAEEGIEPRRVTGMWVDDPVKLAGQVNRMLRTQRVGTRQIIVGISAVNCLSRLIVLPSFLFPVTRLLLSAFVLRRIRSIRRLLILHVSEFNT